ncbi:hypothetical protein [Phormidium sp. CCY1219]|uniref:hypothetical protein n=1 Tax=Phormidium sp. CCY1219 TaxID=2886104 RepID=UPI002D1F406C|nr:hypothetical protein [Phormidium sp. CCY1219]MEB3831867.1 hypothetical protein [Phormidium sp. CCY1219]
MSDNLQIIYPTIDVFQYDLADGLGQSEEKIKQNRQKFWQKLSPKITPEEAENYAKAESEASPFVELLGDKKYQPFPHPQDGYYYPVKVGDTYALLIDCSGEKEPRDKKGKGKAIAVLKYIDEMVRAKLHTPPSIGESWLVWGQLPIEGQDRKKTAQDCLKHLSLFADFKWEKDLKGTGEFCGATFYDLWRVPSDRGTLAHNRHLVICLFQPHASPEKIQHLLPDFIQLFRFRNKVIWAYRQSRQLKSDMKQAAQVIQTIVKALPNQVKDGAVNLKLLQDYLADTLTILSTYGNYLSRLEEQQHTLAANLKNYQRRVEKIAQLDKNNGDCRVEVFREFADYAMEKYQPQIESDIASLSAGLRLLENAIKTIEGIINLEQTKSDRALNLTVAAVGTGLAVSGVTATVATSYYQPPENTPRIAFLGSPALWWSLGIGASSGAIVAGAIALVVALLPRLRRR